MCFRVPAEGSPGGVGGQDALLRGVIVVPFVPSDSALPTLVAASRTTVVGQRDQCVIVPNSLEYAREGDDPCGAQRLAVMAIMGISAGGCDWWQQTLSVHLRRSPVTAGAGVTAPGHGGYDAGHGASTACTVPVTAITATESGQRARFPRRRRPPGQRLSPSHFKA